MNNVLTPSLSERKRIIKNICKTNKQWKPRMTLAIVLFVLAVGIMAFTCGLLICHPTTGQGVFIWLCVGVGFSIIPLLFGLSERNKARFKCGMPYSSFANGTLFLNDNNLEYVFWRVGPHEPAAYSSSRAVFNDEDKFVYSIDKAAIQNLEVKDDICVIKGNGRVAIPEWAYEDADVKANNKTFTFITAFEQSDANDRINSWIGYQ